MTVVGFAGHGSIHPDNAQALLNDFFGATEDEDGYPVWPDEEPILYYFFDRPLIDDTDGLGVAFQYSDYADLDFYPIVAVEVFGDPSIKAATGITTNEVDVVEDIPAAIVKYLAGRGQLIVLWGEEDESDPATQKIVEAAIAADIKVLDLTAGMDSISFEDAKASQEAEKSEPTRTPPEMVEEPEELTQGQDEAQQTSAPDHLRVDHATQQGLSPTLAAYERATELLDSFFKLYESSRELSLAITKRQEMFFWLSEAPHKQEEVSVPAPEPEPAKPAKTRGRPRKG